jgi:hypothetical protein
MPYQTGQTCVDTALQAAQYQASLNDGSIVNIGNGTYVTSVTSVSATAISYKFTNVSSNATVLKTVIPAPLPCANLSSADFLQMSWLVASAWVAAACFKLLYKMALSPLGDTENVT